MGKNVEKKSSLNATSIALVGVMTALTCIWGPLSIPIGAVPISLTMVAIYLSSIILGSKKGTLSYIIYLCIGCAGVPVFSNFSGGPSKLLGPTGGYLIGFLATAYLTGLFAEKFLDNYVLCGLGMVLGIAVSYILGTLWFSYQSKVPFGKAFWICVMPFVAFDLIKIVAVLLIGPTIKRRLMRANII